MVPGTGLLAAGVQSLDLASPRRDCFRCRAFCHAFDTAAAGLNEHALRLGICEKNNRVIRIKFD